MYHLVKLKNKLGYKTKFDIDYGIIEVYNALKSQKLDYKDIRMVTVKYYKYLLEADKVLKGIKIDDNLF